MPDLPVTRLQATPEQIAETRRAIQTLRQLETPRTIIQPLTGDDLMGLTELLRDERVSKPVYLFEQPFGYAAAERWISKSEKLQAAGDGVFMAVRLKDGGHFIGEVHIDVWPELNAGEYGGVLATTMWGNGTAEEAAIAVSDWLYDEAKISLLTMTTARDNSASERVIRELGMTFVEERDCRRPNGTLRPSLYFEQTRSEWQHYRPFLVQRRERMERFALRRDRQGRPAIPGLEVKSS